MSSMSSADDAQQRASTPPHPHDQSLAEVADWGPMEDWSDWIEPPTGAARPIPGLARLLGDRGGR